MPTELAVVEQTSAVAATPALKNPSAVDPEVVENLIQDTKIGARIKRLRLRRSMAW